MKAATIAGMVVGVLGFMTLMILGGFVWRRRSRSRRPKEVPTSPSSSDSPRHGSAFNSSSFQHSSITDVFLLIYHLDDPSTWQEHMITPFDVSSPRSTTFLIERPAVAPSSFFSYASRSGNAHELPSTTRHKSPPQEEPILHGTVDLSDADDGDDTMTPNAQPPPRYDGPGLAPVRKSQAHLYSLGYPSSDSRH